MTNPTPAASLDEQADVDLDEFERLVRDYMSALERGCPMDGGIPLVTAFAKQGGEHRVILKLIALARRALAPEDDVHRRRSEMCERFLREHHEVTRAGLLDAPDIDANPISQSSWAKRLDAFDALMKEFGLGK